MLTIGLTLAISFGYGHIAGKDAIYFGGSLAAFAVAFFCARKGLASRIQCTIAALVIALLCAAPVLAVERQTSLWPASHLLLVVPGWLGASPRIHATTQR